MPAVSALVMGRDLLPAAVPALSVYVHIPFCHSRCRYCDFYFETGWSERVLTRTLDRIVAEAEFFMTEMNAPEVRTVYFGGGTPSVIPPGALDRFLSRLRSVLFPHPRHTAPSEWSFEANPEGVSRELLSVLRQHGIDRLSLGVQSFDDGMLRLLTRRATRGAEIAALTTIRAFDDRDPLPHLNIDLMTGIPGQSSRMIEEDLELALCFRPDHFSVYSLTIEERTPLAQMIAHGQARPATGEEHERLWFAARDRLARRGFEHYEVSNFALPGARSRHNQAYWRLDPYIGLGPGAVSTVPVVRTSRPTSTAGVERGAVCSGESKRSARISGSDGEAEPLVARLKNPNLFQYSSAFDPNMQHEVELLSAGDFLLEHFLTGLRTEEGVSLGRIREVFGLDLSELWRDRFSVWVEEGKVEKEVLHGAAPAMRMTDRWRLLLDSFLLDVQDAVARLEGVAVRRWPPALY